MLYYVFFGFFFLRGVESFIDLHATVQFSQHHLLKRLFSIYSLASFVKDYLTVGVWVYFWALIALAIQGLLCFHKNF